MKKSVHYNPDAYMIVSDKMLAVCEKLKANSVVPTLVSLFGWFLSQAPYLKTAWALL